MNAANLTLSLLAGVLFAGGAYQLLQRRLLRVIFGLVLFGHAANLVLLAGGGPAGRAPETSTADSHTTADPLPQAMALTAVVITFAVTALLLALADRGIVLHGDDDVPDDVADRRLADRTRRTEQP